MDEGEEPESSKVEGLSGTDALRVKHLQALLDQGRYEEVLGFLRGGPSLEDVRDARIKELEKHQVPVHERGFQGALHAMGFEDIADAFEEHTRLETVALRAKLAKAEEAKNRLLAVCSRWHDAWAAWEKELAALRGEEGKT